MRGDNVLHASILFVCITILLILPALQSLRVFFRHRSTTRHNDYRTLKRWQVCQPHPALGKGRLTEQAEYKK